MIVTGWLLHSGTCSRNADDDPEDGQRRDGRGLGEMKISVAGLGKLGACMAACFASRGFDVTGIDTNASTVDLLNSGRAPVLEPGLDALIADNAGRLRATTSYRDAIAATDATFVVVPTPSMPDGSFSLEYAASAMRGIGAALREKDGYHLVVLSSTVLPGGTGLGILPLLEEASGKRCGPDFGLCYSPEFIALGSVIRDFLNPDFLLVGESDARAGETIEAIYRQVVPDTTPIARMSFAEAELTKLSVNTFVTTKITFANMLAGICERLPEANVDTVSRAIGLDSRIGRKYLTGGLGYGGPCFPRDNAALAHLARSLGVDAALPESTDAANRRSTERILCHLSGRLRPGARVALLGLAYKPATPVVEESPGLALGRALAEAGYDVQAYDPLVRTLPGAIHSRLTVHESPEVAFRGAEAIIVANADPAFDAPELVRAAAEASPGLIVDCWRRWAVQLGHFPGAEYLAIGATVPGDDAGPTLERLVEATLEPAKVSR